MQPRMRRTLSAAQASQISGSVWRSHGGLRRDHSIEPTKRSVRASTIGRWQASRLGPDYGTTDVCPTRRIYAGDRLNMELVGVSFNLLNSIIPCADN